MILSDLSGAFFSVTIFFCFLFSYQKTFDLKKETFGLLNQKRDEIKEQRNHHSYKIFIIKQKRKVVIGLFTESGSDRPGIFYIWTK